MKTKWVAMLLVGTMLSAGFVRADDPNPDVAKAIEDIAARRAEKEAARVKQVETWSKGEGRERAWSGGFGGGLNAAPGAQVRVQTAKQELNPAPRLGEKKQP